MPSYYFLIMAGGTPDIAWGMNRVGFYANPVIISFSWCPNGLLQSAISTILYMTNDNTLQYMEGKQVQTTVRFIAKCHLHELYECWHHAGDYAEFN